MTAIFGGKAVEALRQKTAELEAQVEAVSVRLDAANDRLAVLGDRLTAALDLLDAQSARAADAERRVDALAGLVAEQATAILRLGECDERRAELDRRMRADIIRLERQAMIDVAEMRQTSLALAECLLPQGRKSTASTNAKE